MDGASPKKLWSKGGLPCQKKNWLAHRFLAGVQRCQVCQHTLSDSQATDAPHFEALPAADWILPVLSAGTVQLSLNKLDREKVDLAGRGQLFEN